MPSPMARAPMSTERPEDSGTQRIRVGALGLACVFLLVMLATALLRAAGDAELANQEAAASANAAEPSEPLAKLGVAPGNPAADDAPAATMNKAAIPPRR